MSQNVTSGTLLNRQSHGERVLQNARGASDCDGIASRWSAGLWVGSNTGATGTSRHRKQDQRKKDQSKQ